MIVYIATFGRSGSTFFRIVLNRVFGVPSYAGLASSEDLTTIGAEEISGYKPFSDLVPRWDSQQSLREKLNKLDQEEQIYFIKTHSPNPISSSSNMFSVHSVDNEDQDNFRTIVIVRDGRDTLISFANYFINLKFTWKTWFSFSGNYPHRIADDQKALPQLMLEWHSFLLSMSNSLFKLLGMKKYLYQSLLKGLIKDQKWDQYHRRILARQGPTTIVHYDQLIADPVNTVNQAMIELGITMPSGNTNTLPTFAELNQLFPEFFNSGKTGRWRKEMPENMQHLFWQTHGETMQQLGYSEA